MDAQYLDILKQLLVAGVGALAAIIVAKIRNKTTGFSYHWETNRIALSAKDSIFGDVQATWQGTEVRNLHMFIFNIENTTTCDFENLSLRVYSGDDTLILNEKTELVGTPYIAEWSPTFRSRQLVESGQQPTESQIKEHHHNREYVIPVVNRGQKIRLSYLCTRPKDDAQPMLFLATSSKGIRLKQVATPTLTLNPIFGVPVYQAITRALLISVLVVIACSMYLDSIFLASSISMFVGLTGQIYGALLYKVERFFINLISG